MRMIDKDEAIKILCDGCTADCDVPYTACITVQKIIDIPTIEAEPIKHGRWIFVGKETMHDGWTYRKYKCTECDFVTVEAKNFCQNCGCKMNGGADDAPN